MLVDLVILAIAVFVFLRVARGLLFRLILGIVILVLAGSSIDHTLGGRGGSILGSTPRSCTSLEVIAVRGSGEHSGYGRTLWSLVSSIKGAASASLRVRSQTVDYLAYDVGYGGWNHYSGNYKESIADGRSAFAKAVSRADASCLALVGYSQGAQIVGDEVQDTYGDGMSAAQLSKVVAVVLIGDPRFRGSQGHGINIGTYSKRDNGAWSSTGQGSPRTWSAAQASLVRSYCIKGDPICNFTPGNVSGCKLHSSTCVHSHYFDTDRIDGSTYTETAAAWVLSRAK